MPDDPNKKMDELLKAYAEERRKAPKLYLHPATRRMLQGEVSRVLPSATPQPSWLQRFRSFWPQIAFGTSLCLILGIAIVSLRQPLPQQKAPSEEKTLGEKDVKAAEDSFLETTPPVPQPQDTPVLLQKKDGLERQEVEELRQVELRLLKREQPQQPVAPALEPAKERFVLQEAQLPAPTTAPTTLQREDSASAGLGGGARSRPAPSDAQSRRLESLQDQAAKPATDPYSFDKSSADRLASTESEARSRAARVPAQSSPAAPSSPGASGPSANAVAGLPPASVANRAFQVSAAEKLARANEMTNLGAARRLQFVQVTSPPAPTAVTVFSAAATPATLFTSFQMEQLGRDIRFLDNDGSVYLGMIDQPTNLPGQVVAGAVVTERRLDERLSEQTASSAPSTNAPAFSFTAQGTNVTLGKNIVLSGQFFERTNATASALDSLGLYYKTQPAGRNAQRPEPLHTIIGTAVIGDTNQVPVRAISRE